MLSARCLTLAIVVAGIAGCGGDTAVDDGARLPVSVLRATPSGPIQRTVPLEFTLSQAIGSPVVEDSVAISPPVPLKLRWMAPDRLAAIPTEPLRPNTRYVARILPSAVGRRHRLMPAEAIRFHTPLFAVDVIDSDGWSPDPAVVPEVRRVWVSFTHAVRVADVLRYVVVRSDDEDQADIPFEVAGPLAACRNCELILKTPAPVVRVDVAPELIPAAGGVALEKPVRRRLVAAEPVPFRLIDVQPDQIDGRLALRLRGTRSLVDPISAGAIRIEPRVGHAVRADGRAVVITGGFQPNTDYRVTVPSLRARDGSLLAEPFEGTAQTPALEPELAIRNRAPVLSPTDVSPIMVNTVGVRTLGLRTFAVPVENLAHVIDRLDEPNRMPWPTLGEWSTPSTIDVTGGAELTSETVVRAPMGNRPGLRLLEVRSIDAPWLVDRRWLQAGWSLAVKRGYRRTRVQVLNAATRRPVDGVDVRLRTTSNDPIGPVRTDGNGVALLRHRAGDEIELVVADRRGETAVLDLKETEIRRDVAPVEGGGPVQAFVLPAQDRFRRSDSLPVLVVVRGEGFAVPSAGTPIAVQLKGPSGRMWSRQEAPMWRSGGAQVQLSWPADAPDGVFTVEALVEERVVGRAKVRLQGQQALPSSRVVAAAVQTSTGSARLRWTPKRPRPGQAIRVRWLAPAPGWVTVSLESSRVLAEVRREVGQGPASFTLAVPPEAAPGAHLVVTFEPIGEGRAMSDRAWLAVGRRRPMDLRLELPPGPHRSGSTIAVRVQARGVSKDGAHVVLRAVAPAALDANLAEERDLFRFFHRQRSPSWRSHAPKGHNPRQTIERRDIGSPRAAATLAESGSVVTQAVRVRVGKKRRIFVTLPQRQGKLRIDAIGWSDGRLGTATAELEVRDPLALEAAMPSVLTRGDTIDVPVRVFRGFEGPAAIQLTAKAEDGLQVVSTATMAIELAAGGDATRVVRTRANGVGRLVLQATTGGQSVTWRRQIEVVSAGSAKIAARSAQAQVNRPATLAWPPQSGRSRVVVGTSAAYRLGAPITRLARADRDDLETVAARTLVRQVLPDLSRPEPASGPLAGVRGRWRATLTALERCMSDEGPRAWPGGPPAEVSSVVLAGHAVVRAARRGLVSTNFDRWISAVRTAVRSGAATPRTVGYGQWVLALGRRADGAMLQQLQAQWAKRPPDLASGAALGAALILAGRPQQAAPFIKFADVAALETPDAAFALAALADAAPRHSSIPDLTGQLVTAMSGGRSFGFQTDALALTGLALAAGPAAKRTLRGRIRQGGQDLRAFFGVTRTVVGDFEAAARSRGGMNLVIDRGPLAFASLVVEGGLPSPDEGSVAVQLKLTDSVGRSGDEVRIGDRVALSLLVGPLPDNVPDLRMTLPIPGGLTVTGVEGPDERARVSRRPGELSFDLRASARAVLQVKLQASATYAGDFALGPAVVSSALRPGQFGTSEAQRLTIKPRR